jgi:hypothetical protein
MDLVLSGSTIPHLMQSILPHSLQAKMQVLVILPQISASYYHNSLQCDGKQYTVSFMIYAEAIVSVSGVVRKSGSSR